MGSLYSPSAGTTNHIERAPEAEAPKAETQTRCSLPSLTRFTPKPRFFGPLSVLRRSQPAAPLRTSASAGGRLPAGRRRSGPAAPPSSSAGRSPWRGPPRPQPGPVAMATERPQARPRAWRDPLRLPGPRRSGSAGPGPAVPAFTQNRAKCLLRFLA